MNCILVVTNCNSYLLGCVMILLLFINSLQFVMVLATNVINEALHKKTESGRLARTYLLSGDVVPDKVIFDMITEKLASAEVAHQGMWL